jgi:hypothetical protein
MALLPADVGVATFGIWHCYWWRAGFATYVSDVATGGLRCCYVRWTELLQPWAVFSDEVSVMFMYHRNIFLLPLFCGFATIAQYV